MPALQVHSYGHPKHSCALLATNPPGHVVCSVASVGHTRAAQPIEQARQQEQRQRATLVRQHKQEVAWRKGEERLAGSLGVSQGGSDTSLECQHALPEANLRASSAAEAALNAGSEYWHTPRLCNPDTSPPARHMAAEKSSGSRNERCVQKLMPTEANSAAKSLAAMIRLQGRPGKQARQVRRHPTSRTGIHLRAQERSNGQAWEALG